MEIIEIIKVEIEVSEKKTTATFLVVLIRCSGGLICERFERTEDIIVDRVYSITSSRVPPKRDIIESDSRP